MGCYGMIYVVGVCFVVWCLGFELLQEFLGVWLLWCVEQLGGWILFDDVVVVEEDYLIGDIVGECYFMCGYQDCCFFGIEFVDEFEYFFDEFGVECVGDFVE